ncbi:MFS transporter [Rudaeicoccus suwonensis]|uniref:Multidrug efflux pump Tap n=1 Tax=Rudaeicoccus suwonensis TaxID=657409 RepID=A0A561E1H2_9MICO|nr:MFS transporter [Rudaeicoccus suwonensis]TWE09442.1 MFS transporter [Rudaeicoccus suwonensis]
MSSRRPFIALAIAETFSISGTRLSQIAIPWLVLTTTGSATWTGVVGFAEILPYVVVKALGGPIVDRVGAKRVAVTADSVSVLVVGLIPVLHWLGALHLAVLLPIAAVMGAVRGPSDGAKGALIPGVAAFGGLPLERVTGVEGAIERLGSTVGAAAAGGVVALVGAPQALAVNAVTFAIAAICIGRFVPRSVSPARPAAEDGAASYVQQLHEGWRFLRADAVLVGITVMISMTNFLDQAWSAVLVPVWAESGGHSVGEVGLVFAALSGPSILGAVVAASMAQRLPRLPVYLIAFLAVGLPRFLVMAVDSPLWLVLVVIGIGGFGSGFLNPILSAVIFERIPEPLIGRVSALNTSLCWSLIPFGGLVGGVLATSVGLRATLIAAGVCYFLVTLMPLVRKSFREFSTRPTVAPGGVAGLGVVADPAKEAVG